MKKLLSQSNRLKAGLTAKRSCRRFIVGLTALAVSALALPACKAWRTITTSATYVQSNDSAQTKTTTTISTKTVEEYQGVKKK